MTYIGGKHQLLALFYIVQNTLKRARIENVHKDRDKSLSVKIFGTFLPRFLERNANYKPLSAKSRELPLTTLLTVSLTAGAVDGSYAH